MNPKIMKVVTIILKCGEKFEIVCEDFQMPDSKTLNFFNAKGNALEYIAPDSIAAVLVKKANYLPVYK